MKYIDFKNKDWQNSDLIYTYSHRFTQRSVFVQKDDCIESSVDASMPDGYDYIGLLFKDTCPKETKITTECYFHKYGAPLLLIANEVEKCADNTYLLIDYIEIVIWENGINVWKHWVKDQKDSWELLMGVDFDVPCGEKVVLSSEFKDDMLMIEAQGKKMQVNVKNINDNVHLGILACEGINRFYSIKLD